MSILKKIFLGISIYMTFITLLNAQQVVSTGGDYMENTTGSISFTIGEMVIETLDNETNCLTQGFQQTILDVYTFNEKPTDELNITIYPNPTRDYIKVKTDSNESLKYQLCNMNGELMRQGDIREKESSISFLEYKPAIYLLRILGKNNKVKVFQVIKQ